MPLLGYSGFVHTSATQSWQLPTAVAASLWQHHDLHSSSVVHLELQLLWIQIAQAVDLVQQPERSALPAVLDVGQGADLVVDCCGP